MSRERLLRVLVAFDCAGPSEEVLLGVAQLLEFDRLEVTGLYVEDEDLLRAASLPGLREVTLAGHASALDAERIATEIAREGDRARAAFEALTSSLLRRQLKFTHRFAITRGRIAEALDRAAAESDMVLVTRTLRGSGLRPRQARAFTSLVRQPRHILFINEPWPTGSSVVVLDGIRGSIEQAARLARSQNLRLVVALRPDQDVPELPPGATARRLSHLAEAAIADFCLREDARVLVLPPTEGIDVAELLVSLADRLPCSLLKLA
jgi:hypothetical protein